MKNNYYLFYSDGFESGIDEFNDLRKLLEKYEYYESYFIDDNFILKIIEGKEVKKQDIIELYFANE